jgi:DNA-damage-inducible protein J
MLQNMTTVQARIPVNLKNEAEILFRSLGLTASDAIRVFFQQAINEGGIPFMLRSKTPNAQTQAAMLESQKGETESFSSVDEMFDSWKA